jgi:hypothetical protein
MENTDLGSVLYRIDLARAFTKGWHENIKRWRKLYNFDHYFDQRPALPHESRYADPTFTNTVDLAVGIFIANEMIWKASSWKPTAQMDRVTSAAEKYLAGLVDVNSDRNGYDIRYEVDTHFVRDGGAVLYTVWDGAIAKRTISTETFFDYDGNEYTAPVYSEPPLRVQVIDPLNILLLPGGTGRWAVMARTEVKSVFDVETMFAVELKEFKHLDFNAKLNLKHDLVDYWEIKIQPDSTEVLQHAIVYAGNFVPDYELKVVEGYAEFPFAVSFYKPTDRMDSRSWQSILTPLETPVLELEKSINRRQRQIDMFSSLPLVAKTNQGRQIALDPGLGNIVNLSLDEDFGFPQWTGNPPDVERQIEFFRSRVQQSGFSDVMYGGGASDVSGYALSQLGDQNRIRLEQPLLHLETLWSWWAKQATHLTEYFSGSAVLRVYGKSKGVVFSSEIKGEDLRGLHVVCEIKPEFPNEQVRKHAMASQVRGLLSEFTIMQNYLGIQQPDEERLRKLQESAETNPIAVQYGMMNALMEMAKAGDTVAEKILQTLQQQIVGQAGRPEEPPNPSESLGVEKESASRGGLNRGGAAPQMLSGEVM